MGLKKWERLGRSAHLSAGNRLFLHLGPGSMGSSLTVVCYTCMYFSVIVLYVIIYKVLNT